MPLPENPHRHSHFTAFLETLVSDERYACMVASLREVPQDRFYEEMRWHSVEDILARCPIALEALQGFGFRSWDPEFGPFSPCNLKAQYIPDEDFVNGGRAYVLFNLVANNWTYVAQVPNQAAFWPRTTT